MPRRGGSKLRAARGSGRFARARAGLGQAGVRLVRRSVARLRGREWPEWRDRNLPVPLSVLFRELSRDHTMLVVFALTAAAAVVQGTAQTPRDRAPAAALPPAVAHRATRPPVIDGRDDD